ncbi:MAG: hypothetical protein L0216_02875 [Planctomycetales bacterium]|nr:hypothetical protein [Planctomycetales bacterium]
MTLREALERLRRADRRRRLARIAWAAAGGAAAGLAVTGSWAAVGGAPWPAAAIAPALGIGLLAGALSRRRALPDSVLARLLDGAAGLPETVAAAVSPVEEPLPGFREALEAAASRALAVAPSARLPRVRPALWPGAAIAGLLALLLHGGPVPPAGEPLAGPGPDPGAPSVAPARPPDVERQPDAKSRESESPPEDRRPPQSSPPRAPRRGPAGGPEPTAPPPRLPVRVAKVPVRPLFGPEGGERRTLLLPDPAPAAGAPGAEAPPPPPRAAPMARAEEAALAERIADPREREAVRRYFDYLLRRGVAEERK